GAALSAVALAALSSSLDDAVAVHDSLVSRVLLALRPTLTEIVSVNDSLATVSMIARSESGSDTVRVGELLSYQLVRFDTTPPVLSLPANITAEATGPAGAVVTYSASATDVVDGSRPVTCTSAPGSTFAIGSTIVSCSASDS